MNNPPIKTFTTSVECEFVSIDADLRFTLKGFPKLFDNVYANTQNKSA